MPDLTTTTEVWEPPEGQQLTPTDIGLQQATLDNQIGQFVDALGGPNLRPANNFATVVPTSGMGLQAGGTGQVVIAQGRILDSCPATALTVATAGGSDRIDLIAIKATRVAGSTTISRMVRADNATPQLYPMSGILAGGTATVNLPTGYTVAPMIIGPFPVGTDSTADLRASSVSTAQVVFVSDDSADTRAFSFLVAGNRTAGDPQGSLGVSSTIPLYENRPDWVYVQNTSGTPLTAPSPPSGYDAYAQVYVHASETSISSGDITYLFPQSPALSLLLILNQLTLGQAGAENNSAIYIGNNSAGGGSQKLTRLSVNSSAAAATILGSLIAIDDLGAGWKLTIDTNGNVGIAGNMHATEFFGSGAGLTSIPGSGLAHGDYVDVVNTQMVGGAKTFSALLTAAMGLLAKGAGSANASVTLYNTNTGGRSGYTWQAEDTGSGYTNVLHLVDVQSGAYRLTIDMSTGNITIGNNLVVPGTLNVTGLATLASLIVNGQITAGGANKAIITDDGTNGYLQSPGTVFLKSNTGGTPHQASLDTAGVFHTESINSAGQVVAGTASKAVVTDDGTNAQVKSVGAVKLVSNTGGTNFTATLDTSGQLTVPNNLIAGSASKAVLTDDGTNGQVKSPGSVKLQSNTGGSTQTATFDTSGNLTIPGEFIGSATALTGVPIGGTVYGQARITNTQTQTYTLPAPLPSGNWSVKAHANFNMNSTSTVTLSGVDGGTSWENPADDGPSSGPGVTSTSDAQQNNNADIYLMGTAVAGNQPSVTLASSIASPYVGYYGPLEITCIRTS